MSEQTASGSAANVDPTAAFGGRRIGIWTPIVLTILCAAALFLPSKITDGSSQALMMVMFFGPVASLLIFLIWWLFFSKTTWKEKLVGLGGAIGVIALAALFSHESMVMALMMYLPLLLLIGWTLALVSLRSQPSVRWIAIPFFLLPAAAICMSLRFDGVTGEFDSGFSFRFKNTAEQDYLAARNSRKPADKTPVTSGDVKPLELAAGDWPAFRGANRDGVVRGVKIRTDWKANPPKQVWRQKIGPGWSSVAVVGNRIFTQEQRGPDEAVVCLSLDDGTELWSHVDKVRFEEPVAGAGPRATPTFADGRLFTMGGRGILNALDAATGKLLWTHDLVKEFDAELKEELDPTSKKNRCRCGASPPRPSSSATRWRSTSAARTKASRSLSRPTASRFGSAAKGATPTRRSITPNSPAPTC